MLWFLFSMFLHFQRGRYLQVPADKFVETFHQAWYQSCFMRCTASPVSQAYSKKKRQKKIALLHLIPFWNAGVMNSFKIDAMKACVFLVFIEGRRHDEDFTHSLLSISLLQEPRYQKLATRHVGPFLLYRR